MLKRKRKIISVLMTVCVLVLAACGEEVEETTVENSEKVNPVNNFVYIAESFEVPFEENSFELDHITENEIGLLVNPEGEMEWYTISRSVKEKYRNEAEKYLEEKKSFEAKWLEYRVWRFTSDEDKNWKREEVEPERGIADESPQFVKADIFYGADNRLYLVMRYEEKASDEKTEYRLCLYSLAEGKWEKGIEVSYQDGEEELSYPVACYVNSANQFLVAQTDGAVRSYVLTTGEQKDISSDFSFDVGDITFKDGMGYSIDDDQNRVVVFDDETLVEEYSVSIPEESEQGNGVISVGHDDQLILLNRAGIYRSDLKEGQFTQISSADIFSSLAIEHLVFNKIAAVDQNEFYISMYDMKSEEAELKFFHCKGVERE